MIGLYKYFSRVGLERPTFDNRKMLFGFDDLALATLGGSLIGAVGDIISTNSANDQNERLTREMQQKQMDYNAAEAEKQRAWTAEQTRLDREYNTPANQRKRLEAAGINPALAMGSPNTIGALGGASAASVGSTSIPSKQPLPYGRIGDAMSQFSQSQLISSQVRNNDADTLGKIKMLPKQIAQIDAQISKLSSEKSLLERQGKNTDEVTRQLQLMNELKEKTMDFSIKSFDLNNDLVQAQINELNDQIASRGFRDWLAAQQFSESQRVNSAQIQSWKDAASVAYGQLDALRDELKIKQGHLDVEQKESAVRRFKGIVDTMTEDLKRRGLKINIEQQEKYLKGVNSSNVSRYIFNATYAFGDWMSTAIPVIKILK